MVDWLVGMLISRLVDYYVGWLIDRRLGGCLRSKSSVNRRTHKPTIDLTTEDPPPGWQAGRQADTQTAQANNH